MVVVSPLKQHCHHSNSRTRLVGKVEEKGDNKNGVERNLLTSKALAICNEYKEFMGEKDIDEDMVIITIEYYKRSLVRGLAKDLLGDASLMVELALIDTLVPLILLHPHDDLVSEVPEGSSSVHLLDINSHRGACPIFRILVRGLAESQILVHQGLKIHQLSTVTGHTL